MRANQTLTAFSLICVFRPRTEGQQLALERGDAVRPVSGRRVVHGPQPREPSRLPTCPPSPCVCSRALCGHAPSFSLSSLLWSGRAATIELCQKVRPDSRLRDPESTWTKQLTTLSSGKSTRQELSRSSLGAWDCPSQAGSPSTDCSSLENGCTVPYSHRLDRTVRRILVALDIVGSSSTRKDSSWRRQSLHYQQGF